MFQGKNRHQEDEERGKDRRGAALQTAGERKKRQKNAYNFHLQIRIFQLFTQSVSLHIPNRITYINNEKSIFCQNTAPVDRGNFLIFVINWMITRNASK